MRFSLLLASIACANNAAAAIIYSLAKNANPSADKRDAYTRIEAAMNAALARWRRSPDVTKTLFVSYNTGVPTANGNYNGGIRFGANRSYMNERTALHEISHTLGIGQTTAFNDRCATNNWPTAMALLQMWDGPNSRINCGGGHIWPYGLNYDNEFSATNAERHVALIAAMLEDGL